MDESLLLWGVAALVVAAIVLPYVLSFRRRGHQDRARKEEAVRLGTDRPMGQFPSIDAARCIGCGACVDACPEGDILGVVGGTATVVNGLKCVGHGRCAQDCPVGAIAIGLGDLAKRPDVPRVDEWNQATEAGVFLAGEVTGMALVKNAVAQSRRVVERIAQLAARDGRGADGAWDIVVIGAGPAGLTTAAAAAERGLRHVVLEQEPALGGTIAHYPRRKLVLVQAVDIPLLGRLPEGEYSKERLLEILLDLSRRAGGHVRYGEKALEVKASEDGLSVVTALGTYRARFVVLAPGRRGTPRKLGVPGEEQTKVLYQLEDAESYRGQRILVVGGGDSAVEAALGLSRQPGNAVTLSYRREKLVRVKRRNEERIAAALRDGRVEPLFSSEVREILPDRVRLEVAGAPVERPNDYVFVFAGGEPPFPFLRKVGVRFGGEAGPGPSPS